MGLRGDAALGHGHEVPAVVGLAVAPGALHEPLAADPAVLVGDLLGDRDRQVLGALDGADELGGLEERLHGAGVQPRVTAAERLHGELAGLEVHAVEVGDLVLAAGGGLDEGGPVADVAGVEVQAGHGVAGLGLRGLLLDGDRVVALVELHDAEALRVVHAVAEDRGALPRLGAGHRAAQPAGEAVSVEDVVAQDQGRGLAGAEVTAYDEGLRQAVGLGLLGVGERHAEVRAIPQQSLEVGEVRRGGDDQDVPYPRQHEGGERVVDHRLVIDRQQLLAGHARQRVQARARTAGEDDALHIIRLIPFVQNGLNGRSPLNYHLISNPCLIINL